MDFVERMLDDDVQNNSVWSFRYFLVLRRSSQQARGVDGNDTVDGFSKELVDSECKYVLQRRLPDNWRNEASWAYLRGMLATTKAEAEQSKTTNAKRWFIGDFGWMHEMLEKWGR